MSEGVNDRENNIGRRRETYREREREGERERQRERVLAGPCLEQGLSPPSLKTYLGSMGLHLSLICFSHHVP